VARQRIRLREVRRSDQFEDQLNPAQIRQAEFLSDDEQDFLKYLLSQVRQILGTAKWYDAVPPTLRGVGILQCVCTAVETVGSLVYISGNMTGGLYTVRKTDPTDIAKMPVMGLVVAKTDLLHANVQYHGPISGIWSFDLVPGKPYFVGTDGEVSLHPPTGNVYVQKVGVAIDRSAMLVTPDPTFIQRVT
jgi:hypothetical protein